MVRPREVAKDRLPLTRERVIEAAVAHADAHGVDALSMRKLAEEVGFGVMSLYNHVANKDEMIEAMVDFVVAEIDPPTLGEDWQASMRASAASANAVLLRHPWVVEQWTKRMPGPARLRYMEAVLAALACAGLSDEIVYHGYHAITMHIVGFTQQQLGYKLAVGMDLETVANDFLAGLPAGAYPHLVEHVRAHLSDGDHGDEFGFVLDLILDGLARARA